MLFYSSPNVKSICQRVGIANICFSTGCACESKKDQATARSAFREKPRKMGQKKPMPL